MTALRRLVHSIDALTDFGGRVLAWLGLGMALLTAAIVVLRYGFNTGSIMAQELVTYMHGALFMPDQDIGAYQGYRRKTIPCPDH